MESVVVQQTEELSFAEGLKNLKSKTLAEAVKINANRKTQTGDLPDLEQERVKELFQYRAKFR